MVCCIDTNKYYARVDAIDHPILGEASIRTSQLLNVDFSTGNFETLNTLYVPVKMQTPEEVWNEHLAKSVW
jgi:hypothetical protein